MRSDSGGQGRRNTQRPTIESFDIGHPARLHREFDALAYGGCCLYELGKCRSAGEVEILRYGDNRQNAYDRDRNQHFDKGKSAFTTPD